MIKRCFYSTLEELIWKGMKKDICYKEMLVYKYFGGSRQQDIDVLLRC